MPLPKIKNIVIAVLLAANLFFLAIVLTDAIDDRRIEKETLENLTALCENSGVSLMTSELAHDSEALIYTARRSVEAEKKIAETLLGDTESRESGGNVYTYTGDRGIAVFRTGGDFAAELEPGALRAGGAPVKSVEKLLQDSGVMAETAEVTELSGGTRVLTVCTLDRVKIWNCSVETVIDGDLYVTEMVGRVFCAGPARASDSIVTSAPTAIVAFISAVRSGEVSCKEIRSVELGYIMSATPFGETQLTPAWRVTADSGNYYIDAVNGELFSGAL